MVRLLTTPSERVHNRPRKNYNTLALKLTLRMCVLVPGRGHRVVFLSLILGSYGIIFLY